MIGTPNSGNVKADAIRSPNYLRSKTMTSNRMASLTSSALKLFDDEPVPPPSLPRSRLPRRSSLVHRTAGSSSEGQQPCRRRRSVSLSFAMEATRVKEIPRYDEECKHQLFYDEAELNLMRCEANMRRSGMDPASFDWRSFR